MTAQELRDKVRNEAVGHLLGLANHARTNPDDPITQKIVTKLLVEYADEYLTRIEVVQVVTQLDEVLHEPLFVQ